MFDFGSNIFIAFLISISFFIVKTLLNKPKEGDKKVSRKIIVSDTFSVFVISYLVLSCKQYVMPSGKPKVTVFTNEPDF
jgi:hypothetical protein